jgi:hypothetical protein
MLMARQMGNVMIDYDLYIWSLKVLQEVYRIIRDAEPPEGYTADQWQQLHQEFDGSTFDHVQTDFEHLRRCGQLYEQRAMIGNSEVSVEEREDSAQLTYIQKCTALINQREVEISKNMSAESTLIARSAHRDGQSLRIIQYLGLVFLPLSLCTVSSMREHTLNLILM